MKYFILVTTLIATVSAQAVPVPEGIEFERYLNASARLSPVCNIGFGMLNGGTRGGQGGATFTVWDGFALRDALNNNAARIVVVRGRIDLTALFTGSPGIRLRVGDFTTLQGGDRNAEIFGGGIVIQSRNVIVQNLKFNNALSYAPGETPNGNGGIIGQVPGAFSTVDAIDIDGATNVWVDHCEFSDDPWNAANTPDDRRRHDGLIDMKHGANWISISNNIFRNHNMVALIGASDNNAAINANRLKVTYATNWFRQVSQRNPFVRFGEVHVLNNLYNDISFYAVGAGVSCQIYAERNVFINVNRAFTGDSNPPGQIMQVNNRLVNSGTMANIPSNVGWRPAQYYHYYYISVNDVENFVRNVAGVRW